MCFVAIIFLFEIFHIDENSARSSVGVNPVIIQSKKGWAGSVVSSTSHMCKMCFLSSKIGINF